MSFSSEEEVGPLSPVAVSIAAGFSGAIAAAASHSFDTARTRAQCVILPKVKKEDPSIAFSTLSYKCSVSHFLSCFVSIRF